MTDDDGRRRWRSPLTAVRGWWSKRRQADKVAALAAQTAAKVASSIVAKIVAGAVVVAGAGAGLASIPDTLDGRDAPATHRLDLVDVAGIETEAAALRDALDAVSGDMAGLLAQMDDVDVPDVTGIIADVTLAETQLANLRDRLAAVQTQIDTATFDVVAEVGTLRDRLGALATTVTDARAVADDAALLASQVVSALGDRLDALDVDVAGQSAQLLEHATRLTNLAADVDDLASGLADTQFDVEGLLERVDELSAAVEQHAGWLDDIDTRTAHVERLATEAYALAFEPTTLDGTNRGIGPTFDTRATSLVSVSVATSQPGEVPAATIWVVRTDEPWAGYDWSNGPATPGEVIHQVTLPADGSWRIEVDCDQPCHVGIGHVVVQPVGTLD